MAATTRAFCLIAAIGVAGGPPVAVAQTSQCVLIPDDQNPPEKILRCGNQLTIHTTPGTRYEVDRQSDGAPGSVRIEAGTLMLEFHAGDAPQNFQILTPQAIASVRGTRWIVDVGAGQTSTFVMVGTVLVTRRNGQQSASLGPGQGADVDAGGGPIVVKQWSALRVRTLLARFGQ
jgi:hypothetical protein